MIDHDRPTNDILGVGLYTSIMRTFHLPSPINYIRSTSVGNTSWDFYLISNKINPWNLPTEFEPKLPSSAIEVSY